MRKTTFLLPIIVLAIAGILSSIFIVTETQKALVLQFGRVVAVKEEPGLAFKIPLIQEVVYYDDRILSRDIEPLEVTPLDDRRLVVDAFARYRITDVQRFREAVGAGGEEAAARRVDGILRDELRAVLGSVPSNDILSVDRAALMQRIRDGAVNEAQDLGLEIVDVRLKRTDLPEENLQATFDRMIAERQREAEDERARGREAAQRVRAQADRTVVELTSDAERQAQIARGEADARRNGIFADAFGSSPDFFAFYRSLIALERSLQRQNSTLVLSPNSTLVNELFDAIQAEGIEVGSPAELIEGLDGAGPGTEPEQDAPEEAPIEGAPDDSGGNETPEDGAPVLGN
ncbi:protease modulator HflC [Aestuariibius sp. 2305UL40-4]|uniref:protease modulator HflC n=1 Tax=Aestuariibius violaceus TaxID=3234132 RepID=UPI00345EF30C